MAMDRECDVAIVGGGLAGLSLALALSGAGLSVVVVDREAPAVSAGDAAAWGDIRVSDGRSRLFLHYDHADVADHPLGYIVENRHTRRALQAAAAGRQGLTWLAPMAVDAIATDQAARILTLADGGRVAARLLVGCDGKRSFVRAAAGIGAFTHRYGQTGIVATLRHTLPHANMAHERFLPAGPFAMLPLPDVGGAHRSSIVWTERDTLVPRLMALDDDAFAAQAQRRFGDWLGVLSLEGRRFAYPLEIVHAHSYVGPRVALAGDAAHAIHPIAGQGFNLGLRDVAALAECVVDAARLGLDIGAADTLARYASWRRVDTMSLLAVTDALNRLFSNDIAPLRLVRDLGLAAIDHVAPLKRLFMRHAMGVVGDLPRLVRGEPL